MSEFEPVDPLPEIMVDSDDEAVVDRILRGIGHGLQVGEPRRSTILRLTRWRLDGAEAAAKALQAEDAALAAVPEGSRLPSVDVVLAALRARLHREAPGWEVEVDRDHDITTLGANPHIKIGDPQLAPVQVAASDLATGGVGGGIVGPGAPEGPVVGIADAQMGHQDDLAGRYLAWPDASGEASDLARAHATFVAGTVLRQAPDARLSCRAVLVHGDQVNRSWEVAERLLAFRDDGVAVLNMSFGCHTDGPAPFPLRRAVDLLAGRIALVAAGGNENPGNAASGSPVFPAALPGVLGVGAVHVDGSLDAITPHGAWVDVYAPGVDVVGAFPPGVEDASGTPTTSGYARWSGSSFATAFVAGAIARLIRKRGLDPSAASAQVLAGSVPFIRPATDGGGW